MRLVVEEEELDLLALCRHVHSWSASGMGAAGTAGAFCHLVRRFENMLGLES
jgi:hypothetical protein